MAIGNWGDSYKTKYLKTKPRSKPNRKVKA